MSLIDGTEHAANGLLGQVAGAISDRLIRQRQGIAHRTCGRLTEQTQGRHFERDLLLSEHVFEVTDNRFAGHLF